MSLSLALQYCITKRYNQSTLGLGIKRHHKFRSRELIDTLNANGYTVTYEDILNFRKSAAKYVSENKATLHHMMGLNRRIEPGFGWFDNFDLAISFPNGRRETHAMATEFQVHPAGLVQSTESNNSMMSLTTPRLTAKQSRRVESDNTWKLLHYTGPKKVLPPKVPSLDKNGANYAKCSTRQFGGSQRERCPMAQK
ncbi:hypothetical protein DPMN_182854 [Dreissena polymorpha]|uniref:Uncharacterized protein n=1 Tax=Dreissena polymorpha TaxID=45954 RepID=A0A9D4DFL8_DREPO|nr:hypothetical protein DPMN_182854 [Dreissena polymorpha]